MVLRLGARVVDERARVRRQAAHCDADVRVHLRRGAVRGAASWACAGRQAGVREAGVREAGVREAGVRGAASWTG